jgi:hypothetical protein
MPIFLAALLGGFVSSLGSIVGRVLISLGLGFVTYSGFSVLLDWIKAEVFARLLGVDQMAIAIFSLLQIDSAINILFSAIAIRFVIQGVSGGTFTKAVWKA